MREVRNVDEATSLYDDFVEFIQAYDGLGGPGNLLQDFLLEWLEHGDAVIESGGDFGTYLKGVILIIARWLDDPSILDIKTPTRKPLRRRRASGVLDLAHSGALCFDRDYFNTVLMRRMVQRVP